MKSFNARRESRVLYSFNANFIVFMRESII